MASRELFTCDFPVYSISSLREGEFYLAGGGGRAKTGVPNALEVYSLFHDGQNYVAERSHHFDLGDRLIMNSAPHPHDRGTIAASIGPSCYLFSGLTDDSREEEKEEEEEEEERKKEEEGEGEEEREEEKEDGAEEDGEGKSEGLGGSSKKEGDAEEMEMIISTRTDFAEKDSYQKIVKFSHDGAYVVTGGVEGVVRVWKYPSLEKVHKLVSHENEIESLDCHPTKLQALSVCRGGEAIVWNLEEGRRERKFEWTPNRRLKYKFRACCFSPSQGDETTTSLYTINVPLKWNPRAGHHAYLLQWDAEKWDAEKLCPLRSKKTGKELLCALSVSHSGTLVAVGSADGTISVYNSRNLKLLRRVSQVHSVFVTGLAFVLAADQTTQPAQKPREALLSVSADRTCCVTMVTAASGFSTAFLLFILLPLLVIFIAMATTLFL